MSHRSSLDPGFPGQGGTATLSSPALGPGLLLLHLALCPCLLLPPLSGLLPSGLSLTPGLCPGTDPGPSHGSWAEGLACHVVPPSPSLWETPGHSQRVGKTRPKHELS